MSKWRCNECDSTNVESKVWTSLNNKTADHREGSEEPGDNWCGDCGTHGRVTFK